jgi:hypothetical protein
VFRRCEYSENCKFTDKEIKTRPVNPSYALADILLIADVPCDDAILTSLSALLTKSQNLISKPEQCSFETKIIHQLPYRFLTLFSYDQIILTEIEMFVLVL